MRVSLCLLVRAPKAETGAETVPDVGFKIDIAHYYFRQMISGVVSRSRRRTSVRPA